MFQQSGKPCILTFAFHFGMHEVSRMEALRIGPVLNGLWIQCGKDREKPHGKQ